MSAKVGLLYIKYMLYFYFLHNIYTLLRKNTTLIKIVEKHDNELSVSQQIFCLTWTFSMARSEIKRLIWNATKAGSAALSLKLLTYVDLG